MHSIIVHLKQSRERSEIIRRFQFKICISIFNPAIDDTFAFSVFPRYDPAVIAAPACQRWPSRSMRW
ncbi:MAG: hypothetical protein WD669_08550 [Pirellulales bacterium]